MTHILDILSGTVEIMGEHDAGKTALALQAVRDPSKSVLVDNDEKAREQIESPALANIKFAFYVDMVKERGAVGNLAQHYLLIKATVDKITSFSPQDVIIWDNWKPTYDAIRAHVARNKYDYGDNAFWRGDSTIIQGLVSKIARQIEEQFLVAMRNKARLVIVTSHLTDQYANHAKTGVRIPESSETFARVSYLRLWLRHNPNNSPVPVALVAKRISKPHFEPGVGISHENVLPQKVTPLPTEKSIWESVLRYWENPISLRNPAPEETPTPDEIAMLRGLLTPTQQEAWVAALHASATPAISPNGDGSLEPELQPLETRVAELVGEGKTALPVLINILKGEGYTVTPPQVMSILRGITPPSTP